ncbi:hypothetical protein BDB00DRAFT_157216 [Zychaea mexicana]|uniref:uncharacterized protein n=1 Tax=Zychaea mexicana TaxID=64656 RepID=UPI0022FDE289|nr:uncharacterized protein BDB00DRAFT_157216 [Zychaea mexicana]KAI9484286.1 hypothetical protein BDB00DRAFT_157216 [Zychaea mexicana]
MPPLSYQRQHGRYSPRRKKRRKTIILYEVFSCESRWKGQIHKFFTGTKITSFNIKNTCSYNASQRKKPSIHSKLVIITVYISVKQEQGVPIFLKTISTTFNCLFVIYSDTSMWSIVTAMVPMLLWFLILRLFCHALFFRGSSSSLGRLLLGDLVS